MWKMRAISIGAIWLAAGISPVTALEIEFQASVDRTRSGESDPIRLTLTIRSDETLFHVPAPEISLKDFYVEGPSVSTPKEKINFQTTFTRELVYTLYPRRVGRITIGPARLRLGGRLYETKPIVLSTDNQVVNYTAFVVG